MIFIFVQNKLSDLHLKLQFTCLGLYWSDRLRHAGVQYAVSESRANWTVARDSCHQDSAILAVVTNPGVDAFLRDICLDESERYVVKFSFVCTTYFLKFCTRR